MKAVAPTTTKTRTLDMILSGMGIALVFVATLLLNIKLPITANGGLVHLGTGMLFTFAILFGPKKGAIAGAFGMGLFDLVSGWTLWAPISLVARGLQGYVVGRIAWTRYRNGSSTTINVLAMSVSVPIMLAVYYVGESILFKSWLVPFASIPGNLVQNIVGIAVALPVCVLLKKTRLFK